MANRRMIMKDMLESDEFLELSKDGRLMYLYLSASADDDGFVLGKKRIASMLCMNDSVLEELIGTGFLIRFDSGAIAIRDWRLCNQVKKDRYTPTKYRSELAMLDFVDQVGYVLKEQEQEKKETKGPEKEKTDESRLPEPAVTEQKIAPAAFSAYDDQIPLPCDADAPPEPEEAFYPTETVLPVLPVNLTKPAEEATVSPNETSSPVIPPQITEEEKAPPTDAPSEPPEYAYVPPLPLVEGEYRALKSEVTEWRTLYPAADVAQELRNMRGWFLGHPEKRKTAEEIGRFVHMWLSKAQKQASAGLAAQSARPGYAPRPDRGYGSVSGDYQPSPAVLKAEERANRSVPALKKRPKPPAIDF